MGKLKHDPALVEHGRSLVSGAEHRKKLTGEVCARVPPGSVCS